jgi:biotin-dependent carboxylase-like uncharacterized protein
VKTIEIQAPGLLTTVQDLGRDGHGPMGVSPSGAADPVSLRIGNRLAGNPQGAAGLEMTLLGGTFLFPEGATIALTGSDFGATLDDAPCAMYTSVLVKPGQTLRLGSTRSGARCYLSVQGGVQVEPFLGSASTHLLSGLGGLQGRALRKGDALAIGPPASAFRKRTISARALSRLAPRNILRVTSGPQADWFSESARQIFYSTAYRVAEESNRMGIRLEGATLPVKTSSDMITEGVSLGAVQIPPGGSPIILFVEQQTTGGYPMIANVISADLPSLGQLRPRDEIRFERIDLQEAPALLAKQEELLASEELLQP